MTNQRPQITTNWPDGTTETRDMTDEEIAEHPKNALFTESSEPTE